MMLSSVIKLKMSQNIKNDLLTIPFVVTSINLSSRDILNRIRPRNHSYKRKSLLYSVFIVFSIQKISSAESANHIERVPPPGKSQFLTFCFRSHQLNVTKSRGIFGSFFNSLLSFQEKISLKKTSPFETF